jgi:glycosyltransferase involved in cell wall biosynthesis
MVVHGFPPVQHSGTFRNEAFAHYLPEFDVSPVILCASDADKSVLQYFREDAWKDDPRWPEVQRVEWKLRIGPGRLGAWENLIRKLPLGSIRTLWRDRQAVMDRVLPSARELVRKHKPSVIYSNSPPVECALVADQLGAEFGVPVVLDFRDPWTYYAGAWYRHWIEFLMERHMERTVLSRAARVIANTPTAGNLLITQIGIPPDKVVVIPNGYSDDDFDPLNGDKKISDRFTVVYTGLISSRAESIQGWKKIVKRSLGIDYSPVQTDTTTRSPRSFLKACEKLLDEDTAMRSRFHIVFAGPFDSDSMAILNSFRYQDCLTVKPPLPRAEALRLNRQAHLCLLLQWEMRVAGKECAMAIPGKMYDYLRSGTRILAPMQEGDAALIIRELDAGVVVPPRDVAGIAAALKEEFQRWEKTGSQSPAAAPVGLERFSRRRLTQELADLFRVVA